MKKYTLTLQWSNRTLSVSKEFKNKREAIKWARLCCEICGRNEHGELYKHSVLAE